MTVRVETKTGPVTKSLRAPYSDVKVTVRRLRTPEWDSAREAAQAVLRNDAKLLPLLIEHDLLPPGGVKAWRRLRDHEPMKYTQSLIGVAMWLTAVEAALVGVISWEGINTADGGPAPVTREVLEVLCLDDALSGQIMDVLGEAARLLIIEGKPSGASPNGSSEPAPTA